MCIFPYSCPPGYVPVESDGIFTIPEVVIPWDMDGGASQCGTVITEENRAAPHSICVTGLIDNVVDRTKMTEMNLSIMSRVYNQGSLVSTDIIGTVKVK